MDLLKEIVYEKSINSFSRRKIDFKLQESVYKKKNDSVDLEFSG